MSKNIGSIHYTLGLDDSEFKRKAASVSSGMQSMGKKMSLYITAPITAAGLAAFKSASDYEQLTVAMETMLGNAKQAKSLLRDLDDLAVKTPFSISEVQDSARQMLAYGIEADKLVDTTRMLGDVSAGLGVQTFPQLTLAFGQIKAKGKLMGQELLQLTNAGFNVAEAMGVTRGELMEMMQSEKGVSFAQVEKAFERATSKGGRFHNMMKKQSKTTAGQISNLKDELTRLGRDIGKDLLPYARDFVKEAKKWVEWFRDLSPETKKMALKIAGLLAVLGPTLIITGKLIGAVKAIIGVFKLAGGAVKLFGGLTGKASGKLGHMATGVLPQLKGMVGKFIGAGGLWGLAGAAAVTAGVLIINKWKETNGIVKKVQDNIKEGNRLIDKTHQKMKRLQEQGKTSMEHLAAWEEKFLGKYSDKRTVATSKAADGSTVTTGTFASGGMHKGGWAKVGETGPELVRLPAGSQIMNATQSKGVGGVNIYGSINIADKSTADYFLRRLNRDQELTNLGMATT